MTPVILKETGKKNPLKNKIKTFRIIWRFFYLIFDNKSYRNSVFIIFTA